MATATTRKLSVNLLLNNGTTSTGAVKTKTLKLGGSSQNINVQQYSSNLDTSRTNAIALVGLITPCLTLSLYELDEVTTAQLMN